MGYLYDLWDDVISILFPRLCYACGNQLLRNEKLICTECFVLIPRTKYHLEEGNPVEQLFWGRCRIEKAAAFSFYNRDSRIRKLIHNLKYKGIKDIGFDLGRIYGASLTGSDFLKGIDLIIPVPLHPSKKRVRGFNQSDVIAQGLSEATGLPVVYESLQRGTVTETQTRRSRYERWVNVDGIFIITDSSNIRGKHVLLVDDVITTGSTIESCTNELLKVEGVKVSVAALAVAVN
ncbi:MAG: ComF family protein [Bacteroidales bacterium]|jgi:ComF family protein|nr:ComF family protein [Bacteroidales bacterium]